MQIKHNQMRVFRKWTNFFSDTFQLAGIGFDPFETDSHPSLNNKIKLCTKKTEQKYSLP